MATNPADTVLTPDHRCVSLRRATPADQDDVTGLLRGLKLPTEGVTDWLNHFWVGDHEGKLVGAAGMERYGDAGLLRSVAVAPEWRDSGIGRALVDHVLDEGRAAGVQDVYLLTTTAEHYFPRLGFACVDRECVPVAVRGSVEFTTACPASAVVMHKSAANESRRMSHGG